MLNAAGHSTDFTGLDPGHSEASVASPARRWGGLLLVLVIALAARLVPWNETFTPGGVRFRADTDPYYHALRAQRIAADWPHVPWVDGQMNFPTGAVIPWPPLFDWAIAALARASTGGAPPTSERVAEIAALLPVLLGLISVIAVFGVAASLLGRRCGLVAALLVAVLPASVRFSAVGCADQHVAEVLLSTVIVLAFVRGGITRSDSRRWFVDAVALGGGIALAFWNWLGSAFYLLLLVCFVAAWNVLAPVSDSRIFSMSRVLARGSLAGAVLLSVSIQAFGPPGSLRSMSLLGVTGLSVVLCLMVSAFAALVGIFRRIRADGVLRRILQTGAALLIPAVVPFLVGGFREGVGHGITALTRSNAWYRSILEFRPLLLAGFEPVGTEASRVLAYFGLTFFLMPVFALALIMLWRDEPEGRPATLIIFLWGGSLFILTVLRARFAGYAVVPLALWSAAGLEQAAGLLARAAPFGFRRAQLRDALPIAAAMLLVAPAGPGLVRGRYAPQPNGYDSHLIPLLRWFRDQPSAIQDRPAVMAEWSLGHLIQYYAGKPVTVSPFGTEGGVGAMEDRGAFFFQSNPEAADSILRRRRAGFILLGAPVDEAINTFGYAPNGTPMPVEAVLRPGQTPEVKIAPRFWALVVAQLYFFDGIPHGSEDPALGSFRLIAETRGLKGSSPPAYKIFGVVEGARISIRGANPAGEITAQSSVTTNCGRQFEWKTHTHADSSGRASIRLPYATGRNGSVDAGPYRVSDGLHKGTLTLEERDLNGGVMEIDMRQ